MNSLSWLIYAADVVGRAGAMFVMAGVGLLIAGVVTSIVGRTTWSYYGVGPEERAESEKFRKSLAKTGPRLITLGLVLFLSSAMIPSRSTIYMIAASEIGETVVTSPDAVEMMGDLRTIIKSKLKEMTK